MPSATKLQRPRWRRSRPACASLAEISSAMDLVRVRLIGSAYTRVCGLDTSAGTARTRARAPALALLLALGHLFDFLLARSARHIARPLGFGGGLFPRRALQFLPFCSVGDVLCVHSTLIPAYFAISLFNPYPGKLTVTFVSSPDPSRRNTVPRPYFACSMVAPGPTFLAFAAFAAGCCTGGTAGLGAAGGFGALPAKNCWIASTEL